MIPFTKMEGLGNDYIYVNVLEHPIDDPAAFSRRWSDRRTGIGSDGPGGGFFEQGRSDSWFGLFVG